MAQFLWIPWRLPKLNELLDARIRVYTPKGGKAPKPGASRRHMASLPNAYTVMKREWESLLAMHARTKGFSVLPGCWDFTYLFVEPNGRFDPSNISAAAIKFIEDALVKDKRMEGDGWGTVNSITCHFSQLGVPGILLAVDSNPVGKKDLLQQAETMSNADRFHRKQRTYATRAQATIGGRVPGGNQPLGEAPAGATKAPGARVRAQRPAQDGSGPSNGDSGE